MLCPASREVRICLAITAGRLPCQQGRYGAPGSALVVAALAALARSPWLLTIRSQMVEGSAREDGVNDEGITHKAERSFIPSYKNVTVMRINFTFS